MAASTSTPALRANGDPTTAQGRERSIRQASKMNTQIALRKAGIGQLQPLRLSPNAQGKRLLSRPTRNSMNLIARGHQPLSSANDSVPKNIQRDYDGNYANPEQDADQFLDGGKPATRPFFVSPLGLCLVTLLPAVHSGRKRFLDPCRT
jgi:hypothetical protein